MLSEIIKRQLAQLNPNQRAAVELHDEHVLVVSQPGSGKTHTSTTKAAYLSAVDPSNTILAVTFTTDAAREMKKRIDALLPGEGKRIGTGNFHSLALAQLKRARIQFNLIDTHSRKDVIRQVIKHQGKIMTLNSAIASVEHFKTTVYPADSHHIFDRDLYDGYQQAMEQQRLHDFHDMLLLATRGMREGTIKPYGCGYILVDEYQDVDEVQYEWVMAHVLNSKSIVSAVGDDDQSIYGWRCAMGYNGMKKIRKRSRSTTHQP